MIIINKDEVAHTIELARKHMKVDSIELAVNAIEMDISDRRGLKNEWSNINEDVRLEIKAMWRAIIRECLSRHILEE